MNANPGFMGSFIGKAAGLSYQAADVRSGCVDTLIISNNERADELAGIGAF